MSNGKFSYGWCSGEHLGTNIEYGTLVDVDTLNVRSEASTSGEKLGEINKGDSVDILEKNCAINSGYTWHKIRYNGLVGYVVAGNTTPNFTFEIKWVALACNYGVYVGDYDDFLSTLAMRESSNNYAAESGQYLGKYQMGILALKDAGFLDSNSNWTALAARFNITDKETFLSSRNGQECAIRAYHRKVWTYLKTYEAENLLGRTYYNIVVTESGLLAAAHLVGAGAIINAINTNTDVRDGNGTPAYEYMDLLKNYDISEIK